MSELQQRLITTPIAQLRLVASPRALVGVYFPDHRAASPPSYPEAGAHAILDLAIAELNEYFAGTRRSFTIPLEPRGTEFQRLVWAALTEIEFAGTRSYGQLAAAIGRPRAVRAVGAANARNPLSLVVPCHRVIGNDGALTGYAGGLERKRWLLAHELAHRPDAMFQLGSGF
ncbi:methylated-DNA--[protein]-cysteine S-methyltransferase [Enhygromyxa salina]|uniref:Methylated-DNA--protein-cysteine methyltransferase n=1 Tax=Enhygromyxa salina TaxID=215803 RepID=A0A2S9XKY1_9BACT|nr:methylated-DNA--[protein]-cysteine S-methyltransferase [Enhygromyxa salina]PRP93492.1 Methylated-DNA--protein-cysteine methyltransferase [Enhygromyxa salina]